jgi:hypothetical protein
MVMSRDQNAGQSHSIKIGNKSFERVEEFRYLGTTITNQNYIHEEINSILKSGNACYHSVQNLLFSRLLSKNTTIRVYRTIIVPVFLCGCETWSLVFREGHRMMMIFENRVLRKVFAPKRDELTGEWRRLHNEELYDLYSLLCSSHEQIENRLAGHIAHMGASRDAYKVWVGRPKAKGLLVKPTCRWEDNIKIDPQEVGCRVMH